MKKLFTKLNGEKPTKKEIALNVVVACALVLLVI